jgi:hypothetical protein
VKDFVGSLETHCSAASTAGQPDPDAVLNQMARDVLWRRRTTGTWPSAIAPWTPALTAHATLSNGFGAVVGDSKRSCRSFGS